MWIVLALALVVGLLLGLMGGGGSILMVPLLTYVAGLEPKQAIAGSLFVVGVTSLVSVLLHSRHGTVRWRTGLIFGAASMVGALLGGVVGGGSAGRLPLGAQLKAFFIQPQIGLLQRGAETRATRALVVHAQRYRLGRCLGRLRCDRLGGVVLAHHQFLRATPSVRSMRTTSPLSPPKRSSAAPNSRSTM